MVNEWTRECMSKGITEQINKHSDKKQTNKQTIECNNCNKMIKILNQQI